MYVSKNDEFTTVKAERFKTDYGTGNNGKFTFYEDGDTESRIYLRFLDVAAIIPSGSGNNPDFKIRLKGDPNPVHVQARNYRIDGGEYLVFLDVEAKYIPDIYIAMSQVIAIVPVS